MRVPVAGFRFSLLCVSCRTERHELINSQGLVIQREYRYPEGYALDFRPDRAEMRLLYERRRKRSAIRGNLKVVG